MSTYQLEPYLREILSVIKPLEEDHATRVCIIDELQAVVESVGSLRGATVEPFGSFISNLYTRWGDLDISVELPNGAFVSSAGKRRKQNLLRDIYLALQRKGGAHNLQFIPMARVPLLIFESNHRNISCDISISNLLGQIKSKFLFWITQIDDRFRDMVLLVKEWAIAQDINNPKSGTLNSYSLCLLVIFHFQTCEPAILPPLQEIYAGNIADDLTGVRVNVERNIQATCAANIARFRSNGLRRVNQSSLSELFGSFFKKFSKIYSKASTCAICTYTGRWENIRDNTRWMDKSYPLLIEDPFEQPQNAARAVGRSQLIMISDALEGFHRRLLLANQDRSSLIASLARPQIRSEVVVRTSLRVPNSHVGGHLGSRTRASAVPSSILQRFQNKPPLPIQEQFQNMQLKTNPSTSVSRVLDVHSQGRQAWRPKQFDQ